MTASNHNLTRKEVARLLAHVIRRLLRPPQNVPQSEQDCLDVIAKEVLTVSTNPVNGNGENDQ